MTEMNKQHYEKLFLDLNLNRKDIHKLYFWPLDHKQKKQTLRNGFDYLEEYRNYFLNYEFNKKLDYHKCTNGNNQRYIIFTDHQHVLADPWELIAKHYPQDLKKLEETSGAHIYFNVLYSIQNFDNIFEMTRHLILRIMEFYGLYDPFQTSSGCNKANFRQLTGTSWVDQNRFCIKCATPIKFTDDNNIFITCSKKCFDNFAKQSHHLSLVEIPQLTVRSKNEYKKHLGKITQAIVKHINKCQTNLNKSPRNGYEPVLDNLTKSFLEDYENIRGIENQFLLISKSNSEAYQKAILESKYNSLRNLYFAFQRMRDITKAGQYSWGKFLLNREIIKNYLLKPIC
jgi:hypothetical protein